MNKVLLIGRLTRDPDIRYTTGETQTAVARFTLAVNRQYKKDDEETADFINCISFGKLAEFAQKYLSKGIKIAVVGRIQTGSYTKKDGSKVYTTQVVVESEEFTERKADSHQDGSIYSQTGNHAAAPASETIDDGFLNISDADMGDLPF